MADRIVVSTDMLEKWAGELSSVQSAIADAAKTLSSVPTTKDAGGELKISMDASLKNGSKISGGDVKAVLKSLSGAMGKTAADVKDVSSGLKNAATIFEESEDTNRLMVTSSGTRTDIYNLTGAVNVAVISAHQYHNHISPDDINRQVLEKKASEWGRLPNSISDTEYAFLCNAANIASHEKKPEKMKESFLEQLAKLPEVHPLRNIDERQVTAISIYGVEAYLILLDGKNAVLAIAGTDDLLDFSSDIGIAVRSNSSIDTNYQKFAINTVVSQLEKQGYDNIQVTGHSLGGYLATDLALKHKGVTECVTYDAPKHTKLDKMFYARNTTGKNIRNYIPNEGIVNKAGSYQPGTTRQIQVNDNWAGPIFHNHRIVNMYEDGMGGMDRIIRQWTI